MRQFVPILQIAGVVTLAALLCAKFPAFMNHDHSISFYGGLLGTLGSLFALYLTKLFSKPIRNLESSESGVRLLPMRFITVVFFVTMMSFTAYLYLEYDWLLTIVGLSVLVGVIAVFVAAAMAWTTGRG